MGVVYRGVNSLYAVHIPDNSALINARGVSIFAEFVSHTEYHKKEKGDLFVFINGINRPTAEDEARNLKSLLNAKHATLYRIMLNLGANSGGNQADSASILVQDRGHIDLLYKHVPDNQYIPGGRSAVGVYDPRGSAFGNTVPNDHANPLGWHIVTAGSNASRKKI